MQELYRVVDVEPYIMTGDDDYVTGTLTCYLEDGSEIILYNVPYDITLAIARLKELGESEIYEPDDFRDTVYGILIMFLPKLRALGESIEKVIIDDFDNENMVYRASLYITTDGFSIRRTMIPSHAIFLALLFNKPVFVTRRIAEISRNIEEEDEEEL
ncbi:MAG: bifunctional nuclease family protein [Desulfurococcales archaeon]|nr:bifunctional nuclease family protein [Desulfurococcales archaeon]